MVRWLWVIDVEMAKMNEIFVGVKEIGYIETQISKLCEKYNSRNGVDYIQQRALFRNYCHDTITAQRILSVAGVGSVKLS